MKMYECVQVEHHKEIARVTKEYVSQGWNLHTYRPMGSSTGPVRHYLLFEKEAQQEKPVS